MRKIGIYSVDIVVACYVLHNQTDASGVPFSRLVDEFDPALSRSGIANALKGLSQWGVIKTEFGETTAGRAGRLYSVSGETSVIVKETYRLHWDRIHEEVEAEKREKRTK